ncbi:hypothetical protein CBI38_36075 (plasmid) [Rhodococcus oxybenzonivorans]|uniref:Uncharacterized protein n=1 Tax=Rhodococcus oxybenzonivorans TaxID=1990687 RepID=A0A2S2C7M4_9NOCA|nr:hypothetical protein [Rhodococcus oxybenzonivorans]AWK76824.1 hypothetical protein CBI38_36075 [Rhodococcus oxybenzonivorans]
MGLMPFAVVILACPIGMAAMIWLMSRGKNKDHGTSSAERQMARLRSEIHRLNAEHAAQPRNR